MKTFPTCLLVLLKIAIGDTALMAQGSAKKEIIEKPGLR